MSSNDVITNSPSADSCLRYHISRVPKTNLFFAVINSTCSPKHDFCHCNQVYFNNPLLNLVNFSCALMVNSTKLLVCSV